MSGKEHANTYPVVAFIYLGPALRRLIGIEHEAIS